MLPKMTTTYTASNYYSEEKSIKIRPLILRSLVCQRYYYIMIKGVNVIQRKFTNLQNKFMYFLQLSSKLNK